MAVQRMVQAGAQPITWLQYMLEMQRDWANQKTYNDVLTIEKDHGGAYGLGVIYANQMFGGKGMQTHDDPWCHFRFFFKVILNQFRSCIHEFF